MRTNLINKIVTIVFLTTMLSSCFKDKGNYDYNEIKEAIDIVIPNLDKETNTMVYNNGDRVEVTPEIKYRLNSNDAEYDFEWSLVEKSSVADPEGHYKEKTVVSTTKKLDFLVAQSPATYTMVFKVTNKQNLVATYKKFDFFINIDRGWMIFDENEAGEGDLQIIRTKETTPNLLTSQIGISRNCFSSINDKKIIGGLFLGKRTHSATYDDVYVFTEEGVIRMKSNTMAINTENFATLFLSKPKVTAPQAHSYPNGKTGQSELFINNGQVHSIRWNMMGQKDKFPAPLTGVNAAEVNLSPFIAPIAYVSGINNAATVYVPSTSSFGQISTGNKFSIATTADSPLFNAANINAGGATDFQLIYMNSGYEDMTCALFKDEKATGNNIWRFRADFRYTAPRVVEKTNISSYTDILDAKYFTFGTRGEYMYYATDNVVYTATFAGAVNNLFTVGAGEKIVQMKLYNQLDNIPYDGRLLFVATYNESTKEGFVYRAELETIMGKLEPGKEIIKYSGFAKIKDMYNKNQ